MTEKITVIVPVYHVEKYINRCIDSIIQQTYPYLEIILVDDGSPDRCGRICEDYATADPRIVVIHQENGGLSSARNAGLRVATGAYISFVDSDDYIASNFYEILLTALLRADADMGVCDYLMVDESGIPLEKCNNRDAQEEMLTGTEALKKLSGKNGCIFVIAWNKLYRKHLFDGIAYPLKKIHEDEFIAHHLLYKSKKVMYISAALYYYVQMPTSIMHAAYSVKRLDGAEALLDRAVFFKSLGMNFLYCEALRGAIFILTTGYEKCGSCQRVKELKKTFNRILDPWKLIRYASFKTKLHMGIFFISPRMYGHILGWINHE